MNYQYIAAGIPEGFKTFKSGAAKGFAIGNDHMIVFHFAYFDWSRSIFTKLWEQ